MQTIFDSTAPVINPTRRNFARGLDRLTRPYRDRFAPCSAADAAWAAEHLNRDCTDYTVEGPADFLVEQWAGESAALDAAERHLSFA